MSCFAQRRLVARRPTVTALLTFITLLIFAGGAATGVVEAQPADPVEASTSAKPSIPTSDEIVVGIHPSPPFVIDSGNGQWTGLSVELWQLMAAEAGVRYRYQPMALDALLNALEDGSIDIAVGALSMTAERERRVDLSHPFLVAGLGIAVPRQDDGGLWSVWRGLVDGGLMKMLGLIAVWLLVSGFLVWLFERRANPAMFGGDVKHGVGSGFWWALVTLTTVGYGDKSPITLGGRMVATVWMLASLVVLSSLTAAITSSLTVRTLGSGIRGPEDLPGKHIATIPASASADWLDGRGLRYSSYQRLPDALDALQQGKVEAVVYDAPILNYLLEEQHRDDLQLVDRHFHLHFYGFGLPPGASFAEPLNRRILSHINSDEWTQLRRLFLGAEE